MKSAAKFLAFSALIARIAAAHGIEQVTPEQNARHYSVRFVQAGTTVCLEADCNAERVAQHFAAALETPSEPLFFCVVRGWRHHVNQPTGFCPLIARAVLVNGQYQTAQGETLADLQRAYKGTVAVLTNAETDELLSDYYA